MTRARGSSVLIVEVWSISRLRSQKVMFGKALGSNVITDELNKQQPGPPAASDNYILCANNLVDHSFGLRGCIWTEKGEPLRQGNGTHER